MHTTQNSTQHVTAQAAETHIFENSVSDFEICAQCLYNLHFSSALEI